MSIKQAPDTANKQKTTNTTEEKGEIRFDYVFFHLLCPIENDKRMQNSYFKTLFSSLL